MRTQIADKELLQEFMDEGTEILTEWEHSSIELEDEGMQAKVLVNLSRSAHNLKGVSKSIGLVDFSDFVHKVEDFIVLIQEQGNIRVEHAIRILLDSKDIMVAWLQKVVDDVQFVPSQSCTDIDSLIKQYIEKNPFKKEGDLLAKCLDEDSKLEPAEEIVVKIEKSEATESRIETTPVVSKYVGSLLLEEGLLSKDKLLECLVEKLDSIPRLSSIVYEKKLFDVEQQLEIFKFLTENSTSYLTACKSLNLWNKNIENEIKRVVEERHRTLSELMISKEYISWEQLIDTFDRFLNKENSSSSAENSKTA
ncbi:MAG: Hpt domain-containing protein [Oligoflexales bacterium]